MHDIKPADRFLAVSRNERNSGATFEQPHRHLDLLLANAELFRDLPADVCYAPALLKQKPSRRPKRPRVALDQPGHDKKD